MSGALRFATWIVVVAAVAAGVASAGERTFNPMLVNIASERWVEIHRQKASDAIVFVGKGMLEVRSIHVGDGSLSSAPIRTVKIGRTVCSFSMLHPSLVALLSE